MVQNADNKTVWSLIACGYNSYCAPNDIVPLTETMTVF